MKLKEFSEKIKIISELFDDFEFFEDMGIYFHTDTNDDIYIIDNIKLFQDARYVDELRINVHLKKISALEEEAIERMGKK